MKTPDENELLTEILADAGLAKARQMSLEKGLAALRRRRQMRQATQVVAALLILLVGFVVLIPRQSSPTHLAANSPPATDALLQPIQESSVPSLTDEELFALFPGQVVALIGEPGNQEFVVLGTRLPQ